MESGKTGCIRYLSRFCVSGMGGQCKAPPSEQDREQALVEREGSKSGTVRPIATFELMEDGIRVCMQ